MNRFSLAPSRLLISCTIAASLSLGIVACSDSDEPQGAQLTEQGAEIAEKSVREPVEINGKKYLKNEDGSLTVDGITYFDGEAYWFNTFISEKGIYIDSKTIVGCQGNDLVQEIGLATEVRSGGSSQRLPFHRACEDGTISPGELTKLVSFPEDIGD